ncbi:MAG: NAD(P)-dependent alcohol dehydrogenase [Pseudomonadota bacterium]
MKSYHFDRPGDVDSLVLRTHDDPTPGRREVLVRLRASSLNYRDIMILEGRYGRVPFTPARVPLSDGAGEIVALGDDVSRFRLGDKVVGNALPRWIAGKITLDVLADQPGANKDGMLTDLRVFHEDALVTMPDHLEFEEAAALPGAGVTAWASLETVHAGETVLIQGTGGVSLFALQFAKLMGARVIATTSDDEKAERLKALGADHVINYRKRRDWHVAVREATAGRGADHVVEIGGAATLGQSIQATALGGQIELVGTLGGAATLDATVLSGNIVSIRWASVGSRANFEAMNRAIAIHRLKPVIDRAFPFGDAGHAFHHFIGRSHIGKVVVRHDG